MKCPHCNKTFEAPEKAYRHAEAYGGSASHVACGKCGKAVLIRTSVRVAVEVIGKGDEDRMEAWR
jgi:predicted RNA-binding Zn-ribbon protein involved in translation (DUF1610 family)